MQLLSYAIVFMIILFLSNKNADFCFNGWLCKSVKSSIILYTLQFLDIILFSCYRMLFLLVDFLLKVLILLFYTCSESARMNNQYLLYASIYHEISRKAVCWIDDSWLQDSVKTIYRRWMKGMFDKNKKRGEAISLLGSFISDRGWWIRAHAIEELFFPSKGNRPSRILERRTNLFLYVRVTLNFRTNCDRKGYYFGKMWNAEERSWCRWINKRRFDSF